VAAADSAAIAIRSVVSAAVADSLAQAEGRAAADSAARRPGAPADTAPARPPAPGGPPGGPVRGGPGGATPAAAQPPRLARAVPPTELVVRFAAPLRPGTTYRVRVTDVRSLSGVAGTSDRTVTTARAEPAARRP
jgi:hypothetical protein